jgi:UDP-GlcNAc3NAcA epimerase
MKIAHIVGNRPQFIKLALLYRELEEKQPNGSLIIHTGQHFDDNMSEIFFRELLIPEPDHRLKIHSLPHNTMIGRMLTDIDQVLEHEKPGCVVVYGDTNTTLAGALAAKKRNIRLAHIESGIRTGKEDMPEESNRYLTDRMSDLNFTCTGLGLENLRKEGFGGAAIPSRIFNTGDLMYDAALFFREKARHLSLSPSASLPTGLIGTGTPFVLATIHRVENTENLEKLRNIIDALNILHRVLPVIFPVHPKTRQTLAEYRIPVDFIMTPPLGYLGMLGLLDACRAVITDSGGLSREAFFFKKPALVVMENPFWPEIFLHGNCLPSAAVTTEITEKTTLLLGSDKPFENGIFGDGSAAGKISEILLTAF